MNYSFLSIRLLFLCVFELILLGVIIWAGVELAKGNENMIVEKIEIKKVFEHGEDSVQENFGVDTILSPEASPEVNLDRDRPHLPVLETDTEQEYYMGKPEIRPFHNAIDAGAYNMINLDTKA